MKLKSLPPPKLLGFNINVLQLLQSFPNPYYFVILQLLFFYITVFFIEPSITVHFGNHSSYAQIVFPIPL
ncbi:hypothetical protein DICPUDRAFT_147472 [Dictyostelium purpureum]|uniref:Uncharacterized protein n=1 Tax=Dictyostelium purpureum TaxID=5786 RepID=F0Z8K3_DICPU|nr:uncharacterized protein DICPUDRAFT_147472 [Dictyostelium purpureum]EGC39774.1 hypothetical protein DICPUDRAFT_147472 [Dictyostelium purpureum]|eukprot:XP_003283760.1 hypothetical protein DICPUDRAFT_147472 [Dictyostelium purpureum]